MQFPNKLRDSHANKENININHNCPSNSTGESFNASANFFKKPQEPEDRTPPFGREGYRRPINVVGHSQFGEGFNIVYTEYEQLPVFGADTDAAKVSQEIQSCFNTSDWTKTFVGITMLRSLNKSYPLEVNSIFEVYGGAVLSVFQSPKPCLLRNLFAFCDEVLRQSANSNLSVVVVTKLVNLLVRKQNSATSSALIGQINGCLCRVVELWSCDEVIEELCSLSLLPAVSLAKIAFHYMAGALTSLEQRKVSLGEYMLSVVFATLGHTLGSASVTSKVLARDIVRYYHSQMGDHFHAFVALLYDRNSISDAHRRAFSKALSVDKEQQLLDEGKMSKAPLCDGRVVFFRDASGCHTTL